MMANITFLSFLLFSMCHSIHVAVNTWLNCSFFALIIYIDDRPTDDQPLMWKNLNGHISAMGRPIHYMFGSTVGFSGSANRMALFPV